MDDLGFIIQTEARGPLFAADEKERADYAASRENAMAAFAKS
jgi:hypothetical protein